MLVCRRDLMTIRFCKCGELGSEELHTCPYKAEINGDYEECNCCEDCEKECADDV